MDFYCSKLLLAIEIDGDSHDRKQNYDRGRDETLENIGIKTVRFKNEMILNNVDGVLRELEKVIDQRKVETNNSPSFIKEGAGG